jgi:hypothetical protein
MILFDLRCSNGHGFEAWFRDGDSSERLAGAGEITCAVCGDDQIEKALMAPNVRTRKAIAPPALETSARADKSASATFGNQPRDGQAPPAPLPATTTMEPVRPAGGFPEKVIEAMTMLRQAQTFIEKNFDHVGRNFAEEARKIHYGETDKRNIYGEASKEEAETLAEEGIEVNQMPWLPSRDS